MNDPADRDTPACPNAPGEVGRHEVLICYDGSADAQAAIERAGQLLPGGDAAVLVIWETLLETGVLNGSLGMGFEMVGPYGDDGTDEALEEGALDTATDGAERATKAGLVAQPRIVNRRDDIAVDILACAAGMDADLIVLGTRGRGGMKSLMLGSASSAVLHHADRSVLAIPSPALAEERHRWADHAHLMPAVT